LRLNPNNIMAWAGKGSTLRFMDKYEEAIECLEKFISLASSELSPQVEEAWSMIFNLKLQLNRE